MAQPQVRNAGAVEVTTSITEILPERDAVNTGIMLQNLSGSVDVYLGPYNSGDGALTTSNGILLAAGASLVLGGNGAVFKDAVYGRTGSGVADVRYLRWG